MECKKSNALKCIVKQCYTLPERKQAGFFRCAFRQQCYTCPKPQEDAQQKQEKADRQKQEEAQRQKQEEAAQRERQAAEAQKNPRGNPSNQKKRSLFLRLH